MRIPRATYRIQLRSEFGFDAARMLLPYLDALGISDLYLSPIARAAEGSAHGYDSVDPTRVSDALGGEAGLEALAAELRARGMGALLDIVPNHVAASPANPWWRDLLARGPESPFAHYFDVDWAAHDGRVLLPILGRPYEDTLDAGELELLVEDGEPVVAYFEHRLPLRRESRERLRELGDGAVDAGARAASADPERLESVLAEQHYRLEHWRSGAARINYRRFFDIDTLAGLRVEEPDVFEAVHALPLGLLDAGAIDGLRIDHVDGLRDPTGYLERLRGRAGEAYIVVEKILSADEALPAEWPVQGTTGYGLMGDLTRVQVEPTGLEALEAAYRRFTGVLDAYEDVLRTSKRRALDRLFAAEVGALVRLLSVLVPGLAVAEDELEGVDEDRLRDALVELTVAMPVYRSYIRGDAVSERDRRVLERALADARARGADDVALLILERALLPGPGSIAGPDDRRIEFVLRWQQLTGPAMAKGAEDTAFYRYNALASLNEVGSEPGAGGLDVDRLHDRLAVRASDWPHALSATATHDAKRGEDVRARIAVLSELAAEWVAAVERWSEWAAGLREDHAGRPAPDRNDEWLVYQTLAGTWPLNPRGGEGASGGGGEWPSYGDRLREYLVKAAREAKRRTSWREPDEAYERALTGFAERLLEDERFVGDFEALQERVAWHGMLNSLAQLLLKGAAPGVPDFYQGTELWSLVLVDPDNRRPVDYDRRRGLLAGLPEPPGSPALARELLAEWRDGRVKLWATRALLAARASSPDLFARGEYVALRVSGTLPGGTDAAGHAIAFARRLEDAWAIAVAPRLTVRLADAGEPPLGSGVWGQSGVELPASAPAVWRDAFTGRELRADPGGRGLPLADLLADFPLALLASAEDV